MSALETDLNPNTYIGLSLPLKRDNNNNFALTKNSLQQSQHNLKNLLLTHPLERVGQPEFGCRLRDICFEPIDADLPKKIDEEVRRAVGVWLPYINIKAVNTLTEDQDHYIKSTNTTANNIRYIIYSGTSLGVIKCHVQA